MVWGWWWKWCAGLAWFGSFPGPPAHHLARGCARCRPVVDRLPGIGPRVVARTADDEAYFREVLKATDPELSDVDWEDYRGLDRFVAPFLSQCMGAIDWSKYAIVGFTTTFQQTLASLCLAKRIKQLDPAITRINNITIFLKINTGIAGLR